MKHTLKKLLFLLMALLLSLSLAQAAVAATPASAITTVQTYAALVTAANGIAIPDAPQGATDVQYSVLKGDQPIAQIRFTLDGATYHFRASACKDAASAGDISGMRTVFGTDGMQTVTGASGEYQLGVKGKNGLAQWYSEAKLCEYSLLTDGAKDADTLKTFADTLRASAETAQAVQDQGTSVDGTVSKISKTSITLLDANGTVYTFTISARTVNMDGKSIKRKSAVRVNYSGTYAEGCEAISIMLTPDSSADSTGSGGHGGGKGGSSSGKTSGKPTVTPKPTATPKATKTPKPTATPDPKKKYSLSGTVTMMFGNMFEVQTAKGDLAAFLIEDAEVKGGENADVGDAASLTYNVVNNATHLLSVTFKHAEPTPTPAPPTELQEGMIVDRDDQSLSILTDLDSDPLDFDITAAKLKGDLDADVGDTAEVTYYQLPGGNIATVVVFSKADPDPTPEPEPTDDPDDIYDPLDEPADDQTDTLFDAAE